MTLGLGIVRNSGQVGQSCSKHTKWRYLHLTAYESVSVRFLRVQVGVYCSGNGIPAWNMATRRRGFTEELAGSCSQL